MDERDERDEYELMRHDQADHLRHEVEILKGDPFIKNHGTNKLLVAVQNLTESVQHLHSLFENVQNELLEEDPNAHSEPSTVKYVQTKGLSDEKLDKLLEQNKHIAKGILSLADKIEDHEQVLARHQEVVSEINVPKEENIMPKPDTFVNEPITTEPSVPHPDHSFAQEPKAPEVDSILNADDVPDFSDVPNIPPPQEIELPDTHSSEFSEPRAEKMSPVLEEPHELPKFEAHEINKQPVSEIPAKNISQPQLKPTKPTQNVTPTKSEKLYQQVFGTEQKRKPEPLFKDDIKIDIPKRSQVTHVEPESQPSIVPPQVQNNKPQVPIQPQNQPPQQSDNVPIQPQMPFELQEKEPLDHEQVNMHPASVDPFVKQTSSTPNGFGRTRMPIQGQAQYPPNISRTKPQPNPFAADLDPVPYGNTNSQPVSQVPKGFVEPNYPKAADYPGTNIQPTIGPPIDAKPSRKKFLGLF